MSRTYAEAQAAYLIARAAYDVAAADAREHSAAFDAYCDRETEGLTGEQADAWLAALCADAQPEPVLVAQSKARDSLTSAENALISWGVGAVAPMATAKQRADLETLRAARFGPTRDRIIDTMMKLDATTIRAA